MSEQLSSLTVIRRAWRKRLWRTYARHARIGTPLVLAGALYILYMLSGYRLPDAASVSWVYFVVLGGLSAFLAPMPMAWSEMAPYPTQDRLEGLDLSPAKASLGVSQLKEQEQTAASVENKQ